MPLRADGDARGEGFRPLPVLELREGGVGFEELPREGSFPATGKEKPPEFVVTRDRCVW